MELEDLAYPLIAGVVITSDPAEGFKDADYAIFLGAFPRKEGMERKDVMEKNISIFNGQGSALADNAKPTVKCVVVGNPANTNAAILANAAPKIPKKNITALTRLDHNRAVSLVAAKANASPSDVKGVIIWGNHSSTQYPDVRHATVNGKKVLDVVDRSYLDNEFITTVQKRGAAIIAARKLSSAASAAKAICDHLRDWALGTDGRVVSMAVFAEKPMYDIPQGVMYSVPVTCSGGEYKIVENLDIDDFSKGKMKITGDELADELKLAKTMI